MRQPLTTHPVPVAHGSGPSSSAPARVCAECFRLAVARLDEALRSHFRTAHPAHPVNAR